MIITECNQLIKKLQVLPHFQSVTGKDIFKEISFFSSLNDVTKDRLLKHCSIHEFKPDEIISRHGTFNEYFYIILEGKAKAFIPTPRNPRYELYTLTQGDFFGEEIIFSSEPRGNTVIAVTDLTALTISPEALSDMVDSSAEIKSLMDQRYLNRKIRRDLRAISVFAGLKEDLFVEVLSCAELKTYKKDDIIFYEGEMGDSFFLIRKGEVRVLKKQNYEDNIIAYLTEGQFFGEMSLISEEMRNATVVAHVTSDLVKITKSDFEKIFSKDPVFKDTINEVIEERKKHQKDVLKNPNMALLTRNIIQLNKEIDRHLHIIVQCTVDTDEGSALLATMPGSRYPYVYPRDSACASRFLYSFASSPLKSGEIAYRLLGEISRFILFCQRDDGYWGQRYGVNGEDKGIYKQEDNVAHGVTILSKYLLASNHRNVEIPQVEKYIKAIEKGARFALKNYYRNEIHLFYSTTSIHESAIEEGYTIWVNFAYLLMLTLIEDVMMKYNAQKELGDIVAMKEGFEKTIYKVFSGPGRYVRRLRPDGVADLRPDVTLMSPFFFCTGLDNDLFSMSSEFQSTIEYVIDNLWDPDLGMLQRYLPFIEDPDTHIHAGNGPWVQYTAMLAQYFYYNGQGDKGNDIMKIIDSYTSKEGFLSEHLTTADRFDEFKRFEWIPGRDYSKEFEPKILYPGITFDHIVEELNHMKNSYDNIETQIASAEKPYISFATPLMWSHAEYAMALMVKARNDLLKIA